MSDPTCFVFAFMAAPPVKFKDPGPEKTSIFIRKRREKTPKKKGIPRFGFCPSLKDEEFLFRKFLIENRAKFYKTLKIVRRLTIGAQNIFLDLWLEIGRF